MNPMERIPVINNHLTVREIGEEIIILSEEDQEIHNLEGTAAFLWKSINGKSSIQEICNNLLKEYEVSVEQAQKDILEFFDDCEKKRLVSFL